MPRVSVLMPCYNAAPTLGESLDSLAGQSLADFEAIVVDDGSTDGSAGIVQARAEQDGRFRLLSIPHQGIIGALNAGLAACRAEYVARMDADDRALPERLERQATYLAAHPEVELVACRVAGFPEEEVREGLRIYLEWQNSLLSNADLQREIFIESPLAHPSVMFRRSVVMAAGGYQDHGWAEDYDLWLRLALGRSQFAKLPETLLLWREHPERITRTDSRYSLENFLRAKAWYLMCGPLAGREAVLIWGAGMIGRRLSKHLLRLGAPLAAFFDIDPAKIGRRRYGRPIVAPEKLPAWWAMGRRPVVLAAVGARGARQIIRARLAGFGLQEGSDWWGVA